MTIPEALEIIKKADIKPKTHKENVFVELRQIVKEKTNDFKNSNNISKTKVDMLAVIQERGIDKETYINEFENIKRSETDAVLYLAKKLKQFSGNSEIEELKQTISDLKDYLSIVDDKNEIKELKLTISDLQDYLSIL